LAELFFVAGAYDDVCYRRPLQEPVQGNLRNGFSGFAGDFVEGVHYFVEIFVRNWRALLGRTVQPAYFREWLAATDFPCKPAPP
jgi:hypothetical protein